jgi:hypothetical protein
MSTFMGTVPFPLTVLSFYPQQAFNLLTRHPKDFDAFRSALLAASDSNSRFRGFQNRGEKLDQGFVGAILQRKRG